MTYYPELNALSGVSYIKTTNTSQQLTSNTANETTVVNGSEITYTPEPNSTSIVYEICFYSEIINDNTFVSADLESYTSGSWSKIESSFVKNWGVTTASQNMRYCNKFMFICTSWTGSRQLRLVISSNLNNTPLGLHQMTQWDGASSTNKFCDTTLIVYSV
tara:strand:- start:535 stop:1017 length:483 start_codon:yes stop_codon:yes gene_type:complete